MIHYVQLAAVNVQSDYSKLHGLRELFQKLGEVDRLHLLDRIEMTDAQFNDQVTAAYANIGKLVLAIEKTRLLGFIATTKQEPSLINALYVEEEYRRHGIGRELIKRMRELVPGAVRVNVIINNHAAQQFYRSLGFIPTTVGMVELS